MNFYDRDVIGCKIRVKSINSDWSVVAVKS